MTRLLLPALLLAALPAPADDRARLAELFAPVLERGGTVTIPPGDYHLDGAEPLPLPSRTTVFAHGARLHFPERLADGARAVLFAGSDVVELSWLGGEFLGRVFDPAQRENTWEPNVSTHALEITTTRPSGTRDLLFRDLRSNGVAGAVIGVHGLKKKGSEAGVEAWAERVVLESCTLLRSGKFMWDYGYLWQIVTWPEDYEPWEVERAWKYFRTDLVRQVTRVEGDRLFLDPKLKPLPVSRSDEPREALSFLGENLPVGLVRGRQYFIVGAGPDFICIAETPDGAPLRFADAARGGFQFVHNLQAAYLALYAPTGAGPGKGALDVTAARDVRVTGCQLSALGDTMHLQVCENIVFANNQILGSRMGAFFLAEFCRNATITGNLIDGGNGSRVMSVEKSCTDVTITGNTFRNGGRGSWINQPVNFILANNVFVNNTTKNEADPRRGRMAFQTGRPGQFPELYFTLHEPEGSYGPVIVRDNLFQLGAEAPDEAVICGPNGRDLQVTGNTFTGKKATVVMDRRCRDSVVLPNPGADTMIRWVDFHHGRR
jgi:hypothetical protein